MKKQDVSPRVPQREKIKGQLSIRPLNWTQKQKEFLNLVSQRDTKIVFVSGPAGSSKTVLATFAALELLNNKNISDILYIRSAVESADNKLGYLPGEVEDKMHYYGVPLLDKLEELLDKSSINGLINDKRVEVMPVNFVRGLSWNAKAIIVDEAQNLTQKELITVLTRIGKFSKCFVLADPSQSDINGKSGGFEKVCEIFKDSESESNGIYQFHFDESDIMRSELVKFLVGRFKLITTKPKEY